MRSITLLPLAALVAAAAGCRSEVREQGVRSVPQRDLTLVTQTAQVQVASPVEMQQLRIQPRTRRPSQGAARLASASRFSHEPKVIHAALAAPTPIPAAAAAEPVADPTPASDRELSPGKTVTVIPASSGPSAGSGTADEAPPDRGRTMVARGGGTCRGRGRGPGRGNAPVPRPDFR